MLPKGPVWQCKVWNTIYPTKKRLTLFYCDPLDCIQSILHSPLMKDHIEFKPLQIFESASRAMRIYTEWLTGNAAWSMQVSSLCQKSPFHSYTSVEPIAQWRNPPWGYPIIRQDQFIRNDRWTSSPSTSNKSCKHSHGFLHESNKSRLPSTCAASYFQVYSPGPKNTWRSGESDDP